MLFPAFYSKSIDYLIIEMDYDDRVLFTKLQKEDNTPLGEILESNTKNYELIQVEGEKCPVRLFTGERHHYMD